MGRRQKLLQQAYDLGQALPDWGRPKQPRIRIITAYDDAIAAYGDIAAARMRLYAERHGYDLIVYRDGFDPARPPAWSKILFSLRALHGADWVVWFDADTLIADLDRPLEEHITAGHDIVMARHIEPSPHPNTGVFLLRNRLWVRAFLRHVYAQTNVIRHPWWEQVAWNILMDRHHLPRINVVDARAFNSLHTSKAPEDVYQRGDFLVHFAGLPDKPALMRDFLAALPPSPATERPQRIGLVTPLYELTGSSRSGIAKHYRHLAEALAARGHNVTVIFTPDFYIESPLPRDLVEASGIRVICQPVRLSPAWERLLAGRNLQRKLVHNLLSIVQTSWRLWKLAPSLDVIETTSFDALALGRCITGVGPGLVTRISTTTEQISAAFQQFQSRAQSLVNALERTAILRSPALLTHTQQHAENIEDGLQLPAGSFAIVPHGIPDTLPPDLLPEPWPRGPTLLFAGQFSERKAIDVVLGAAPALLKTLPDARLIIAGGPWHESPVTREILVLQAAFSERLITVKDPDDIMLERWVHACDVFTAPSRYESFGLIYLEAMRAGKPVVATRVGGIPEVVADGETGLLVPPGDIPALANAWMQLCSDPILAGTMGAAGRQRFLTRFTADEMARRSAALYARIILQTNGTIL